LISLDTGLNRRVVRLVLFEKDGDHAAFERVVAKLGGPLNEALGLIVEAVEGAR